LSNEDVEKISWEPKTKSNHAIGSSVDDESFCFEFEVTKNQEKEDNFTIRDGFNVSCKAIADSYRPAFPVSSASRLSFVTTELIPCRMVLQKSSKTVNLVELQTFLRNKVEGGYKLELHKKFSLSDAKQIVAWAFSEEAAADILSRVQAIEAGLEEKYRLLLIDKKAELEQECEDIFVRLQSRVLRELRTLYPLFQSVLPEEPMNDLELALDTTLGQDTPEDVHVKKEHSAKGSVSQSQSKPLPRLGSVADPEWVDLKQRLIFSGVFVDKCISSTNKEPTFDQVSLMVDIFLTDIPNLSDLQEHCFDSHFRERKESGGIFSKVLRFLSADETEKQEKQIMHRFNSLTKMSDQDMLGYLKEYSEAIKSMFEKKRHRSKLANNPSFADIRDLQKRLTSIIEMFRGVFKRWSNYQIAFRPGYLQTSSKLNEASKALRSAKDKESKELEQLSIQLLRDGISRQCEKGYGSS
jgi:hypothetical protein